MKGVAVGPCDELNAWATMIAPRGDKARVEYSGSRFNNLFVFLTKIRSPQ